jgi:UDP-glucose 6-dehydrogenase
MKLAMDSLRLCRPGVGACWADFCHTVVFVDKNERRVAALEQGEIPIFEPGLEQLVTTTSARAASPSPSS